MTSTSEIRSTLAARARLSERRYSGLRRTAPAAVALAFALTPALAWMAAPAGALVTAPGADPVATPTPATADVAPSEGPVPGAPGVYTWSVRPKPTVEEPQRENFSYDVAAGTTIKDEFEIRNFGVETVTLSVYASDAINSETQAIDLLAAGINPEDVGDWITLERNRVRVEPGEKELIPFTMEIPRGVESGDHTGGIVSSLVYEGTADGEPIRVDRRLGSRVQVRIDGPLRPAMTISNFKVRYDNSLNPLGPGDAVATYTMTNIGNVRFGVDQKIKFTSPLGLPSKTARPDPVAELLPGNSVQMVEHVSGVWPTFWDNAKLTLVPIPVRDGDTFEPKLARSASTGTWAIPWATIVLIVVILIGRQLHRRIKRNRERLAALEMEAVIESRVGQAANVEPVANGHSSNGHSSNGQSAPERPTDVPAQPGSARTTT